MKIIVLWEDDWELRGNGLGNVAHLQYLPALFLMDVAKDLGVRLTFMVEVTQQLAFLKYAKVDRNLALQATLWENTVLTMIEQGFDVQLHIHPQWHEAPYKDGFFHVSNKWNFAEYSSKDRKVILSETSTYLTELLRQINPHYKICAFKAGAWALQPSKGLLEDLEEIGIKIVIGIRQGLKFEGRHFNIDYTNMEEPFSPYYPSYDDVTKMASGPTGIVIIPLQSYALSWRKRISATFKVISRVAGLNREPSDAEVYYYYKVMPPTITASPMINRQSYWNKFIHGTTEHINPIHSLEQNKKAFDSFVNRASISGDAVVPLVIESHTKTFNNKFFCDRVRGFLTYIVENYNGLVEFQTLSTFLSCLEQKQVLVKRSTID